MPRTCSRAQQQTAVSEVSTLELGQHPSPPAGNQLPPSPPVSFFQKIRVKKHSVQTSPSLTTGSIRERYRVFAVDSDHSGLRGGAQATRSVPSVPVTPPSNGMSSSQQDIVVHTDADLQPRPTLDRACSIDQHLLVPPTTAVHPEEPKNHPTYTVAPNQTPTKKASSDTRPLNQDSAKQSTGTSEQTQANSASDLDLGHILNRPEWLHESIPFSLLCRLERRPPSHTTAPDSPTPIKSCLKPRQPCVGGVRGVFERRSASTPCRVATDGLQSSGGSQQQQQRENGAESKQKKKSVRFSRHALVMHV